MYILRLSYVRSYGLRASNGCVFWNVQKSFYRCFECIIHGYWRDCGINEPKISNCFYMCSKLWTELILTLLFIPGSRQWILWFLGSESYQLSFCGILTWFLRLLGTLNIRHIPLLLSRYIFTWSLMLSKSQRLNDTWSKWCNKWTAVLY